MPFWPYSVASRRKAPSSHTRSAPRPLASKRPPSRRSRGQPPDPRQGEAELHSAARAAGHLPGNASDGDGVQGGDQRAEMDGSGGEPHHGWGWRASFEIDIGGAHLKLILKRLTFWKFVDFPLSTIWVLAERLSGTTCQKSILANMAADFDISMS